jgi:type III pantothenate kinase
MNLTIDIGNTSVIICIFKNNKIIEYDKVNLINFSKQDQYNFFKKIFLKYEILNILLSSVVPKVSEIFFEIFNTLKVDFFQMKNLLKICKLKTNIKNKNSIGDDRLTNIIYAKHIYKKLKIIIDFGTATTIDVLDKKGVYDGGVITPGIDLSLKSLKIGTAKLPLVKFKKTN